MSRNTTLQYATYNSSPPPPNLFDHLPSEIMEEIFGWLDLHLMERQNIGLLQSVCSTFRSSIVNTPSYWTDFQFNLNPRAKYLDWIHLKIARAKDAPLSITLRDDLPRKSLTPEFEALLGRSEQWGSFTLDIHADTLHNLYRQIQRKFSGLRRLEISIIKPYCVNSRIQPFPLHFKDSSLLETINFPSMPGLDPSSLPLRSVRHLQITERSFVVRSSNARILSVVLHEESKLQELRLSLSAIAVDDWDCKPFFAPQLKTLCIGDSSAWNFNFADADLSRDLAKFLDLLSAPLLGNFSASSRLINSSTLLRFVMRSSCPLSRLKIECTPLDSTLMDLLQLVSSSLAHLTIRLDCPTDAQPFSQLSCPSFLPHLISLVFILTTGGLFISQRFNIFTDITAELGELSKSLELIGTSRCEVTDLSVDLPTRQRLNHFELRWKKSCMAKENHQVFARLPVEECDLDDKILETLKQYSKELELTRPNPECLTAGLDVSESIFKRLDSAQYLYVRLST